MLSAMGYDTGIDEEKIIEAARYESEHVDGLYSGHIFRIDSVTTH